VKITGDLYPKPSKQISEYWKGWE